MNIRLFTLNSRDWVTLRNPIYLLLTVVVSLRLNLLLKALTCVDELLLVVPKTNEFLRFGDVHGCVGWGVVGVGVGLASWLAGVKDVGHVLRGVSAHTAVVSADVLD